MFNGLLDRLQEHDVTSVWADVDAVVRAHTAHRAVGEAILNAAFLFEKSVARVVTADPAQYEHRGWPAAVAEASLDEGACLSLRDSLVALVTEHPEDPHSPSAYWALGKLGDRRLLPMFRAGLEYHVERATPCVYQIMVALANLDEPVFGDAQSWSYDDPRNPAMARLYLNRTAG